MTNTGVGGIEIESVRDYTGGAVERPEIHTKMTALAAVRRNVRSNHQLAFPFPMQMNRNRSGVNGCAIKEKRCHSFHDTI